MNILVFDVPAESGGALTILKLYYDKAVNDTENIWTFVVSTPNLPETKNVKIIKFQWIKKSWLHRLYFDLFVAHKLVDKHKADEVLSLQNITIRNAKVKQTLYLHQSLPFAEKRYLIVENYKYWIYQNIIGRMIYSSIRKADNVIVQTNWLKEACTKKVSVKPEKIIVCPPELNIELKPSITKSKGYLSTFFYPASGSIYKNHSLIVEATMLLKKSGINNYNVVFTLKGNENKHVSKLYKKVVKNNLPVEFVGRLDIEQTYDYYYWSILIFPSYIESYGLPLLEAKMHSAPILASDCAFSHEILNNYDKSMFFKWNDSNTLASLMKECITNFK